MFKFKASPLNIPAVNYETLSLREQRASWERPFVTHSYINVRYALFSKTWSVTTLDTRFVLARGQKPFDVMMAMKIQLN
jgi:hypothetical protein